MKHIFIKNNPSHPTLVLFHGTGGDEYDLVSIAKEIDDKASILSLRGSVNENGLNRFFKRIKPGVFDEEDLRKQSLDIIAFLKAHIKTYNLDDTNIIALGYSNGANIISSILLHDPTLFKGALLHHPMVPYKHMEVPSLNKKAIFIAAGENDPICDKDEPIKLKALYEEKGADVTLTWYYQGHQLTELEIQDAKAWYKTHCI
ncbi:MAG: alpha/beta hydrolase [Bacillota bacterium]